MKSELSRQYPYACIIRFASDACMAIAVVAVGVAGLSANCWLRRIFDPWVGIHLLFGALLSAWLICHVQLRVKQSQVIHTSDIDALSRHNSRIAYLVMYAVVGTKVVIGLIAAVGVGGYAPSDVALFARPVSGLFDPKDDYQMFLASGLMALAGVRVVIFRLRRRAFEGRDRRSADLRREPVQTR
jgi:cytochrome b561